MAQSRDQQGTGRHPHKSTEEPWPHTKDEGATQGKSHGGSSGDRRMAAGTAKTARMAVPMDARTTQSHHAQSQERDHDRGQEDDLKRREYRGEDGQIHHHTRTYMEQHGGSHDDRSGDNNRSHGGENRSHGRDNNNSGRH